MYDRTIRQIEGVNKIFNISGTLLYPPGFGKTNVGCLIAQKYVDTYQDFKIGIIVHNDIIKKQWEETLSMYNIKNVKVRTLRNVINDFHGKAFAIDVLIVDEAHKFTTDDNIKLIDGTIIHYKFLICLTATLSSKILHRIKPFAPIIDTITLKEAIANGWVSNHLEFNLGIDYTKEEQELYMRLSKPITETLDLFKNVPNLLKIEGLGDTYSVIRSCTNGFIYKYFNKQIQAMDTMRFNSTSVCEMIAKTMGWRVDLDLSTERNKEIAYYWTPNSIKDRCQNFNNIVKRRNDLQNNNASKLNTALAIINKFEDKKSIIFNESTDFAEKLNNAINLKHPNSSVCYHSNIETKYLYDDNNEIICCKNGKPKKFGKDSLKKLALEGLKSGKYKHLVTVKALDEGFDENTINLAIITSGTVNPLQYQQRKGRSFRVNPFDKNEVVLIFNIYMKSFYNIDNKEIVSRDYTKLNIRQKDNQISAIYISNLDDINELM